MQIRILMQVQKFAVTNLGVISFVLLLCTQQADADSKVSLTSQNTKIEFVGSHVVPQKPDPEARQGSFQSLTGNATVVAGHLTAVSVEIETASLKTGNDKLDAHLKSPDFFNVRQYPKATFKSTSIEPAGTEKVKINGELTLLKETKPVSFIASVDANNPTQLIAKFKIDRALFEMTYGAGKVENEVALSIQIKG